MSDLEVSFECLKSLENNINVLLIDVRNPSELERTGTLPGSINIPLDTLENTLINASPEQFEWAFNREKPNCGTPIVFCCQSGNRSRKAIDMATNLGFCNVRHFPGGFSQYVEALRNEN